MTGNNPTYENRLARIDTRSDITTQVNDARLHLKALVRLQKKTPQVLNERLTIEARIILAEQTLRKLRANTLGLAQKFDNTESGN